MLKKRIVFATENEGKMKEIRKILEDPKVELLSLREAGIHADIVEDGETFEENAASFRVMEKAGLSRTRREEDIAYRGKTHHCVYYSISGSDAFIS